MIADFIMGLILICADAKKGGRSLPLNNTYLSIYSIVDIQSSWVIN